MIRACPHCRTPNDDAATCAGCGADLVPAPPTSTLPRIEPQALVLWALLVGPGLALTLLGLVVLESTPVLLIGLLLVSIPLGMQLLLGRDVKHR